MKVFTGDIAVTPQDLSAVLGGQSGLPADTTVQVAQATSVIETLTGVFFAEAFRDTVLSVSDAGWLKRAAVFQTAWLVEQEDALSRMSALRVTQDGLEIIAEDALTFVLAPLAKRALNNCSWAKNGTYRVAPATTSMADVKLLSADNHPWHPMGGL